VKHREYWISHSAIHLLERIPADAAGDEVKTPAAPPPETVSPVENPANLSAAFDILTALLGDRDRDLRLAAAEAFGQLREKRATAVLATAILDKDDFVRQAAERSLATLN